MGVIIIKTEHSPSRAPPAVCSDVDMCVTATLANVFCGACCSRGSRSGKPKVYSCSKYSGANPVLSFNCQSAASLSEFPSYTHPPGRAHLSSYGCLVRLTRSTAMVCSMSPVGINVNTTTLTPTFGWSGVVVRGPLLVVLKLHYPPSNASGYSLAPQPIKLPVVNTLATRMLRQHSMLKPIQPIDRHRHRSI